MPDALSKTVPIWCAVFNVLLFPDNLQSHKLHTLPKSVSLSEHSQIEDRLDGFFQQLKNLDIDLHDLRTKLRKPLRPIWVTRDSMLPVEPLGQLDFNPVILCTASRRVSGSEMSDGGYIQGAGDDSEGWACGLTPSLFWKHRDQLLRTPDEQLRSLIPALLQKEKKFQVQLSWEVIRPTSWLSLNSVQSLHTTDFIYGSCLIICAEKYDNVLAMKPGLNIVHLNCRPKKLGSRDLRKELAKILPVLTSGSVPSIERIHICCPDGKDISIGVALAILCICCDSKGKLQSPPSDLQGTAHITKHFIQQRLSWIMTSIPSASPSRTTLQSINHFLLSELPTQVVGPSSFVPEYSGYSDSRAMNIFSALSGKWNFRRTLTNVHRSPVIESSPAGTVSGTALFQSRPADSGGFQEYLYTESGMMIMPEGVAIPVYRRWIWKLTILESGKESQDDKDIKICVYFVKPDGLTLDYIYQELEFQSYPDPESQESRLQDHIAIGTHPCRDDIYTSAYQFRMDTEKSQRGCMVNFSIDHEVRGPQKDYTSKTVYQPMG